MRKISSLTTEPGQKLGIPAYFYPGGAFMGYWNTLLHGNPGNPVIPPTPPQSMVVTEVFGSGDSSPDPNYVNIVGSEHNANLLVLAYIDTTQPDRTQAAIMADIDRAFAWYQVDGVFFDDVLKIGDPYYDLAQITLYSQLDAYVKTKRMGDRQVITVINPGRIVGEPYVNCADIIVNAEMSAYDYLQQWYPWGWEPNYDRQKFWHLIHDCTSEAEMQAVVAKSREWNAGTVFITDSSNYNTFPPPYWAEEMAAVSQPVQPGPSETPPAGP